MGVSPSPCYGLEILSSKRIDFSSWCFCEKILVRIVVGRTDQARRYMGHPKERGPPPRSNNVPPMYCAVNQPEFRAFQQAALERRISTAPSGLSLDTTLAGGGLALRSGSSRQSKRSSSCGLLGAASSGATTPARRGPARRKRHSYTTPDTRKLAARHIPGIYSPENMPRQHHYSSDKSAVAAAAAGKV